MLIAGGTGSVGQELAAQAAEAGWRVIIHGSRQSSVDHCLLQLQTRYPDGLFAGMTVDIRHADAVTTLVALAAEHYQRLDAVVDCLVTGPQRGQITGAFEQTTPVAYSELLTLSVVYLQQLAHAALPWLKASHGCLVALVSDAGLFPAPRQALIATARAAAVGFIKNFAVEASAFGVRSHCVSSSFILHTRSATRLAEVAFSRLEKAQQRAGLGLPTPADIAPLVLFLCGPSACRMTGQVLSVNGGLNV